MGINKYIFLSTEGYTFQPGSEKATPDIENAQVIGFAQGENVEVAFENLLEQNSYLMNTNFRQIYSYQLDKEHKRKDHYIKTNAI